MSSKVQKIMVQPIVNMHPFNLLVVRSTNNLTLFPFLFLESDFQIPSKRKRKKK